MTDECEFCHEFQNEAFRIGNGKVMYPNRMLGESESFFIIPSIGQLVDDGGHVMIMPKRHYENMSFLPLPMLQELQNVHEAARSSLQGIYRTRTLSFEHGQVKGGVCAGSCHDHAHLHIIPAEIDIIPYLQKRNIPLDAMADLASICEAKGKPYLFLEDNAGNKMLALLQEDVESQLFRRAVAEALDKLDEWDWALFPHWEALEKTFERLSGRMLPRIRG